MLRRRVLRVGAALILSRVGCQCVPRALLFRQDPEIPVLSAEVPVAHLLRVPVLPGPSCPVREEGGQPAWSHSLRTRILVVPAFAANKSFGRVAQGNFPVIVRR